MSEPTVPHLADRARDAIDRGEWQRAYELLGEADAIAPELSWR